MPICNICGVPKDESAFYRRKVGKAAVRLTCKVCQKARVRAYYQEDPEKARNLRRKNRRKDHREALLVNARRRAKTLNIPFSITKEDVVIPEVCPCFGTKLIQGTGKSVENSATLDQIIPGLGYVKGNIQVISLKANTMKSNASKEQLRRFAEWVNSF